MTETAAGIQYSEDGNYWWDGSDWQPVDSQHPGPGSGSGGAGAGGAGSGDIQYSEDGQYWWDGSAWQSLDSEHPGPGGASGGEQLSEDGKFRWDGSQWQPVDGGEGDTGQQDATVDWSQYPLLEALTKVSSVDDWVRHIGLEPDDLNISEEHQ